MGSYDETDSIKFYVYDDDFGKEESEGSFTVSIEEALKEGSNPRWFNLEGGKTGKVAVSLTFTEEEEIEILSDKKEEDTHTTDVTKESSPSADLKEQITSTPDK